MNRQQTRRPASAPAGNVQQVPAPPDQEVPPDPGPPDPGQSRQEVRPANQRSANPRRGDQRRDIPAMAAEAEGWFQDFLRSVAGYRAFYFAYASFQGETPQGERRHGLPILTTKGSVNGREVVDIHSDLRRLAEKFPDSVPHVLVPLINLHGDGMLDSIRELCFRFIELESVVSLSVNAQPEYAQAYQQIMARADAAAQADQVMQAPPPYPQQGAAA